MEIVAVAVRRVKIAVARLDAEKKQERDEEHFHG
jgi:hypothetical protein